MLDFFYRAVIEAEPDSKLLEFTTDLTVEVFGTFVGAWFAIRLYNRQRLEALEIQKKDKASFNRDKIRYFGSLTKSTINFGNDLIRRCDGVINSLWFDIYSIPEFSITAFDDLSRTVHKLDREATYHAYLDFIGDQRLLILYTDLDTLHRIVEEVAKLWRYYAESENISRTAIMDVLREATALSTTLSVYKLFNQGGELLANKLAALSVKFLNEGTTYEEPYFIRLEGYFTELAEITHEYYGTPTDALVQLHKCSLQGFQLISKYKSDNSNLRLDFSKKVQTLEHLMKRIELNFQGIKDKFADDFR